MYKGSAGGEVALLIRRLFNKLNITRERVQFILTTASMPDDNEKAVYKFARDLTASDNECTFSYLRGERERCENVIKYDIRVLILGNSGCEIELFDELPLNKRDKEIFVMGIYMFLMKFE